MEEAQSACTLDNNCQGVEDFFADDSFLTIILKFIVYILNGVEVKSKLYSFCPIHAQLENSPIARVYTKRKKLFNFQIIIKIVIYSFPKDITIAHLLFIII